MKFLLDMGISPRTGEFLRENGHEATHLVEERLHKLPDPDIFEKARNEGSVLLTHDLDFTDLVAASGERLPSVILFRLGSMRPGNVNHYLKLVILEHGRMLAEGAIISVTEGEFERDLFPLKGQAVHPGKAPTEDTWVASGSRPPRSTFRAARSIRPRTPPTPF